MPSTPARVVAALILLSACGLAQLVPGDIGVTGFSATQFSVLHASGSSTTFTIGGTWQGSGTGWTQTILFDPTHANAFIVGGAGFIGRVTVTGQTTATYALITNNVGTVAQMAWLGTQLVVADSGTAQVVLVNPSSGVVTPLTTGLQPWGPATSGASNLNALTVDRFTGDIIAGGNNAIYLIAAGTTTPVVIASGWAPSGSSSVSGLAIDPVTRRVVATLLTVNRTVRIDAGGLLTDLAVPAIASPNALDVDASGNFLVGTSGGVANHNVWRVPNAGGSAALVGIAVAALNNCNGVACVLAPFAATVTTPGGGAATLMISGVPAGTVEGFSAPSLDTSLPIGGGAVFGLSPDALTFSFLASYPVAIPGDPVHWTYGAPPPVSGFPITPLVLPPGALPPGLTFDLLIVAIDGAIHVTAAPVVRVTIL